MNYRVFVSSVLGFVLAAGIAAGSDHSAGRPVADSWASDVMDLEQVWNSTNRVEYFVRASHLFRAKGFNDSPSEETCLSRLDFVCTVLTRAQDVSDIPVEKNRYIVYLNANEIVEWLCDVPVDDLKKLPRWPELRARFVRLMMLQRATWINLYDPTLEGVCVTNRGSLVDFTGYSFTRNSEGVAVWTVNHDLVRERMQQREAEAQANNKLYGRLSIQGALAEGLEEVGPRIERFVIAAFSTEPADLRMLNELLAMGRYEPSERARIVKAVAAKFGGLGEDMRTQVP